MAKSKRKFSLRPKYFKFGFVSLFTGGTFLVLALLTTLNFFKIFVVAFFLIIGAIDLTLYYFFRGK